MADGILAGESIPSATATAAIAPLAHTLRTVISSVQRTCRRLAGAEMQSMESSALTDRRYWDLIWRTAVAPTVDLSRDPQQAFLDRCFAAHLGPGRRFLEVGAGGSPWPVQVARAHHAEAWGIDFSRLGLAAVERSAREAGTSVRLVEADLFDEGALPLGAFDVVYSGGFVEHFTDAAPVMRRLAALVRPGGVVITGVPNLRGINGLVQRVVDRSCYRRHVLFSPQTLDEAHRLGRLRPLATTRYLGVLDLGAINFGTLDRLPAAGKKLFWLALGMTRRTAHALGSAIGRSDGGRLFAPMVLGVYRADEEVGAQGE